MVTPTTLFDKIWSSHAILVRPDGATLLHIDRHLVHDGSGNAFRMLKEKGLAVRRPDRTFATPDHYVSTLTHDPAQEAGLWLLPVADERPYGSDRVARRRRQPHRRDWRERRDYRDRWNCKPTVVVGGHWYLRGRRNVKVARLAAKAQFTSGSNRFPTWFCWKNKLSSLQSKQKVRSPRPTKN